MSASPLFEMSAVIKVPGGIAPEELRTNLQQIGEEMGVDIELSGCAEKS